MANKILWDTSWTSHSDVLTTELNSLGNGSYSSAGGAYDNTSNLDQYMALEINLASLNPTTGAYIQIFMVQSLGGTNYEDAASSTQPGYHQLVATVPVATGSATKCIATKTFVVPPGKFKFVLLNKTNVSLGASGNTVTPYTTNDEVQ